MSDPGQPALLISETSFQDGDLFSYLDGLRSDRTFKYPFPIMVGSHNDSLEMMRRCYQKGVLEYFIKPIKMNELLIKVERYLETSFSHQQGLTPTQYQIFSLFLDSPNSEVPKKLIEKRIWGDRPVHPKAIDVHLYNLRRKINKKGLIIQSIGSGVWKLIDQNRSEELRH